jgi:hypothetical protein
MKNAGGCQFVGAGNCTKKNLPHIGHREYAAKINGHFAKPIRRPQSKRTMMPALFMKSGVK